MMFRTWKDHKDVSPSVQPFDKALSPTHEGRVCYEALDLHPVTSEIQLLKCEFGGHTLIMSASLNLPGPCDLCLRST